MKKSSGILAKSAFGLIAIAFAGTATAQTHVGDVVIDGSLCAGFDCVSPENFGFDTLRLKENNLRIHFDDTSNSASFAANDWRIVINDTSNGGANYFAVEDATAVQQIFKLSAGAPANSLFMSSSGRIGFGTATPVVELHVVDGDSPTLRLEQDGSSGFSAQTWDLASNEANFFIRDVTNGSQLPFRIQPGADTGALYISHENNIGLGTSAPEHDLDIRGSDEVTISMNGSATGANHWLLAAETNGNFVISAPDNVELNGRELSLTPAGNMILNGEITSTKAGSVGMTLFNTTANRWRVLSTNNGALALQAVNDGTTANEFRLDAAGNLTIAGNFFAQGGNQLNVPDYVFSETYPLMPLNELESFISKNRHLPKVPSAKEVGEQGQINMTQMQLTLLEKVEELTLYTLEQQKLIEQLQEKLGKLEAAGSRH